MGASKIVQSMPKGITSDTTNISERVGTEFAGTRLDQFLALQLTELSRSVIATAIRNKRILVDGIVRKNGYRLKGGESIGGCIVQPQAVCLEPEKIDFPLLFEDNYLLLLSKPPGLVVHPGSGQTTGTLVHGLLHRYAGIVKVGDEQRPGIVHRLDKDTSGIMVVAKTEKVHRKLVNCFKNHTLKKEYLAVVHGVLQKEADRIVQPIGRHPIHRQKMAITPQGGKYAASSYTVVQPLGKKFTLVRVVIETGRTHQIRVHMASIGHPVAGDVVYGSGRDNKKFPRQLLHASRLCFTHPITGEEIDHVAPLWDDFQQVLDSLTTSNTL